MKSNIQEIKQLAQSTWINTHIEKWVYIFSNYNDFNHHTIDEEKTKSILEIESILNDDFENKWIEEYIKLISKVELKKQKIDSIWYDYNDESIDTYSAFQKLKKEKNRKEFKNFKKGIKNNTKALIKNIEEKIKEWYILLWCWSHLIPTIINFWELLETKEKKELKTDKLKKLYKSYLIHNLNRWDREIDDSHNRKSLFHRTYIDLINIWITEKEIWFSFNHFIENYKKLEEERKPIRKAMSQKHEFKKLDL